MYELRRVVRGLRSKPSSLRIKQIAIFSLEYNFEYKFESTRESPEILGFGAPPPTVCGLAYARAQCRVRDSLGKNVQIRRESARKGRKRGG